MTVGFSLVGQDRSAPVVESGFASALAAEIVVQGTNGTLAITGAYLIADEFKLGRDETACADTEGGQDDAECENFEAGPAFVALPIDGTTAPVFTAPVPAGSYVDLKFETKNAGASAGELADEIAAAGLSNWPGTASVAIVGTFTPSGGGAPRPFTAYLDGEVKVEMDLEPPLVVEGESGTASVLVDPALWFRNADGTVVDLSASDFATSGRILDFEFKLGHGFTKVELEGFDG